MKSEIRIILRDAVEWIVLGAVIIAFMVAIGRGPWTRWAEPLAIVGPLSVAVRSYRRIKPGLGRTSHSSH